MPAGTFPEILWMHLTHPSAKKDVKKKKKVSKEGRRAPLSVCHDQAEQAEPDLNPNLVG